MRPLNVPARVTAQRVVHESERGSGERVLATTVEVATSTLSRARGLTFRRSVPDGYALVMEMGSGLFGQPGRQVVHMLFVPFPLDVVWLVDGEVRRVARLRPWVGLAAARADRIVELPAGGADGVESGDTLRVEPLDTDG